MPKLVVMRGDDVIRVVDLASADQRIGRGHENDLVLPDEGKAVSRFHAELRHEGDGFVVIDLGSQNGTWIDGDRVTRAAVTPGSEIAIGPYRLVLSHDGDAAQPTTLSGSDPVSSPMAPTPIVPSAETAAASTGGTQRLRKMSATVVTAVQPAKKKSSARVVLAGATPGRAGDPIAWLARQPKPMVLGGFLVLMVATTFLRPSATLPTEPVPVAAPSGGVTTPGVAPPDVPSTSPNAETIARHLDEARKLEANQEYERAIREHLDQALMIDPRHSEALEMTARFRDLAAQAKPPVVDLGTPVVPLPPLARPRPAKVEVVDPNLLPRVAGESVPDWQARNATLAADYEAALERIQAQEWLLAIGQLESVASRHPTYRDVALRLEETRASLRESIRATVELARGLEAKGDLVGAVREYQRASALGYTAADGPAAAVTERMRREGQDAFTRARQYDALGRVPEAIALYERVVRYLPADNPNRKVAEERLQRLRGGA